jgi:branched-chain amino acid transport system ATP-binding protein
MTLLSVRDLSAFYGDFQALFGVSLEVAEGETVAVIGANGAGKSTFLRALAGALPVPRDAVAFDGRPVGGHPAPARVDLGIVLVPEGRKIFPSLSVEENLLVGAYRRRPGPWTLERVYRLFPVLGERRAQPGTNLSGGEQQMLAIGRALMTNPKLMILDEATEGLAPLVRAEIWTCLKRLRGEQQSILVIDKNVDALAGFADRHVIIEKGRTVWTGTSTELMADARLKDRYLHV